MIFNAQQVTDIVSILQRHQLTFIAKQLGLNYLSPTDRAILTAAGVDLNQFTNSQGIVEQAYLFGLLSEALGDERSKGMDYKQFQKFIKSGQFVPLTEEEKFVLEQVKNQSYNDISGLGSKIIQGTRNIVVRANLRQQNKIRNIIKKKAIDAVQFRQSAAKMASEIGHATGDWERDWLRIAYYVLQNSYNYGRARAIFRDHGDDAEVYFDVLKGACQHCRELYLTDPDDEDSAPKIFKLKDILANGNNIGRKAADWLPTVSPIHPYCFNSPAVKIYTSRGWKKIKDIRVGDLVLTHKGRFKRVTQLHIRRCDDNERIYEIEYKTDNKNNGFVRRITGNHPVLTSRGWKRVDELTVSDKLFTPTFICQECGDKIRISCFNDSSLSLTCLNCRRKGSAINQWKNEDFREYMSVKTHEQMLERYKNMSYEDRLRISDKARKTLAEKYKDGHPWMVEAIKKANKTNGKKKTFIERKLLYFCERLGVKTITNMCLKNRNNRFRNKAKCYFPDIFIPSLGIILEADGMQWHKDKKYDENRDKDIKDIWGFDTFRFSEDDIVNHGDEVFNELQRLFNNHIGNYGIKVTEIVSIKRVKTVVRGKDRNLYNFSVEDDESYIADGIVVHNCRCSVRYKDPNMEWDASTLSYTKPKKYVPKNKKLRNIKLNIKVSKAQEDEFSQRLSQAKKDTNTKPTEAEIKAGNYKKGHVRFGGYEYVIENPKGSFRCGVDANGKKWKTKMNNTYGYFLGTLGKDKDHIDVFINDDVDLDSFNGKIYVIDQVNKDKTFDEHKVMYGFRNKAEAKKAYLSNYDKGWRGCGNITGVKKEVFDKWIRSSKRKVKPFADYAEIK